MTIPKEAINEYLNKKHIPPLKKFAFILSILNTCWDSHVLS